MNTQTSISFPAIGQNDRAWRDNLTDKANQAVLADIWNLLKTYSTKAFWFKNFNSNDHNSLPFYLTTGKSFFFTPDIGLVNFNMAMKQISSRDNHRTTQLVQPTPSCLVTPKAKNSLKSQGITSKLLARYIPYCQKPHTKRFTSTLKYCTSGNGSLPLTSSTTNLSPSCKPSFVYSTSRANKSFWPAQPKQIRRTSRFIRKPFVKLLHCSRIINTANRLSGVNLGIHAPIIQLRERSGYPLYLIS